MEVTGPRGWVASDGPGSTSLSFDWLSVKSCSGYASFWSSLTPGKKMDASCCGPAAARVRLSKRIEAIPASKLATRMRPHAPATSGQASPGRNLREHKDPSTGVANRHPTADARSVPVTGHERYNSPRQAHIRRLPDSLSDWTSIHWNLDPHKYPPHRRVFLLRARRNTWHKPHATNQVDGKHYAQLNFCEKHPIPAGSGTARLRRSAFATE